VTPFELDEENSVFSHRLNFIGTTEAATSRVRGKKWSINKVRGWMQKLPDAERSELEAKYEKTNAKSGKVKGTDDR
jgi:hypothetical protein